MSSSLNPQAYLIDLGCIDYLEAFKIQENLRLKRQKQILPELLLFCSHPSVFTLGKRDCAEDFILSPDQITSQGVPIVQSNRGGKITYHGPGQIVVYFIFHLRKINKSIPQLVWMIEEWVIQTLKEFGLNAHRDCEYPGVWVKHAKISALGLHVSHGVTLHGLSLNVCPDLSVYQWVYPCGIRDREVTSMEKLLGAKIDCASVEWMMKKKLPEIFPFVWKLIQKEEIYYMINKKGE